jgi:hypothetical protein
LLIRIINKLTFPVIWIPNLFSYNQAQWLSRILSFYILLQPIQLLLHVHHFLRQRSLLVIHMKYSYFVGLDVDLFVIHNSVKPPFKVDLFSKYCTIHSCKSWYLEETLFVTFQIWNHLKCADRFHVLRCLHGYCDLYLIVYTTQELVMFYIALGCLVGNMVKVILMDVKHVVTAQQKLRMAIFESFGLS